MNEASPLWQNQLVFPIFEFIFCIYLKRRLGEQSAFSVLNIAFFFDFFCFSKGKAPFKFIQSTFSSRSAASLQKNILNGFDPARLEELARQTGFLKRDSKLSPADFVDVLMFSDEEHHQLSLQDCCNDLRSHREIHLSKVGLHKRFNQQSLEFLKAVLAEQLSLQLNLTAGGLWTSFRKVSVADSCKFPMPGAFKDTFPPLGGCRAGKSIMNLQYSFDIKNGNWDYLEMTSARQNDQAYSGTTLELIEKQSLYIRDQGYTTHKYMGHIISKEASFLNRLNPRYVAYDQLTKKPIDWKSLYQRMVATGEGHFECQVTLGTGADAFSCRLIAVPVPEEVWQKRLAQAKKQAKGKSKGVSDAYKERARFSIFVTNVPPEVFSATQVMQVYGIRWQVELIFKTWKSFFKVHKVKAMNTDRLLCQLYAKFILINLNWKIFWCMDTIVRKISPKHSCSLLKFSKQFRQLKEGLRKSMRTKRGIKKWISNTLFPLLDTLIVEIKKGKITGYEAIADIYDSLG